MKPYAEVNVSGFYVNCPHCQADIPSTDGSGSLVWHMGFPVPASVQCPDCGTLLRFPKRLVGEVPR